MDAPNRAIITPLSNYPALKNLGKTSSKTQNRLRTFWAVRNYVSLRLASPGGGGHITKPLYRLTPGMDGRMISWVFGVQWGAPLPPRLEGIPQIQFDFPDGGFYVSG
jgi:hypothetical protein